MKKIIKYNALLKILNGYIYDGLLNSNLTYFYNFGSLLGFFLIIQIVSGILLAFYYIPNIDLAFDSIEHIMREVPYGYIIRYTHANGAAFFFIMVYLHIARTLIYGSFTINSKRNLTWNIGIIIFLLMIITAFIGYSLVYGQMSYWAIAVITNLLTVIPYFGNDLLEYIYGSFNISGPTLTRFYSLHYLLPFIIASLSIAHLITIHQVEGSNPLGIISSYSISNTFKGRNLNIRPWGINFHPKYTIKDFLGIIIVSIFFIFLIFFYPNLLGHSDNYISADPLSTPAHITPEFYLLPFYAILRSIPHKIWGVIGLLSSILVLILIPYFHLHLINTSKFRPYYKFFLFLFFFNFLLLIFIGQTIVAEPYIMLGQIFTLYYFIFLIILIPLISFIEFFFFIILQKTSYYNLNPIFIEKALANKV